MTPHAIEMRGVSYVYEPSAGAEVRALHEIDLVVDSGEYVALIGPNGSGKSTLARHLNALLLPTSGEVRIDGMSTADPDYQWSIREAVGMVFQNPENQMVASTVEEDVAFGLENSGVPEGEIRRRVDDALERVGLVPQARRPPSTLSGGQVQRAAIAGVLAMRPKCILLDEPTSMLDPVGQLQVMETLEDLNREEAITIIHITQSMDEAALARRVVVMDVGHIILDGPPTEVFRQSTVLNQVGLELPAAVLIADELRYRGLTVCRAALTVEQLVECLC